MSSTNFLTRNRTRGIVIYQLTMAANRIQLRKGEVLILASDGIVETRNRAGELLGFDRLLAACESLAALSPEEMKGELYQLCYDFAEGLELDDDATIMILKSK